MSTPSTREETTSSQNDHSSSGEIKVSGETKRDDNSSPESKDKEALDVLAKCCSSSGEIKRDDNSSPESKDKKDSDVLGKCCDKKTFKIYGPSGPTGLPGQLGQNNILLSLHGNDGTSTIQIFPLSRKLHYNVIFFALLQKLITIKQLKDYLQEQIKHDDTHGDNRLHFNGWNHCTNLDRIIYMIRSSETKLETFIDKLCWNITLFGQYWKLPDYSEYFQHIPEYPMMNNELKQILHHIDLARRELNQQKEYEYRRKTGIKNLLNGLIPLVTLSAAIGIGALFGPKAD